MRSFFTFLFLFFCFSVFSVTIETNHSTHMYAFFVVEKVPVDIRVTKNSIVYYQLRYGNSNGWDDALGTPSFPITDSSMIGRTVWGNTYSKDEPLEFDLVYCPDTSACSKSICETCLQDYCKNHGSHTCFDPDSPDNPDYPDNPDPDNPDSDNPDSAGKYALEATLQSVKALIFDSNKYLLSQQTSVDVISTLTSKIDSGVKSIDTSSKTISSSVSEMKSDLSRIKSDVGSIKQIVTGGDSPSSPSRLESISVTSSPWDRIKQKLLPSYSFFGSISGNDYRSFNFVFAFPFAPGASISYRVDFPFHGDVSGSIGSSTLGTSLISSLNNFFTFFRKLLLVLMAWAFLKVILLTLRQW